LEQSDEEEITKLGMKHAAEKRQIIIGRGDQVFAEEWKIHFYPVQ
jgi:hypothetical protein